jgi:Adaptin N terminal region
MDAAKAIDIAKGTMDTAKAMMSNIVNRKLDVIVDSFVTDQPRGLHNFIGEIKNAANREEEIFRIEKELGNIRGKFTNSANLSSYQKKKYVWKMCYIAMLGHDVDFGHMEFISLLSSTKFQEKAVGYMAVCLLLRPSDSMMTMAVNSMRNDLMGYLHFGKSLALAAIANIGGVDLALTLAPEVQNLLIGVIPDDPRSETYRSGPEMEMAIANKADICKKATLCVLRLFRSNPDSVDISGECNGIVSIIVC